MDIEITGATLATEFWIGRKQQPSPKPSSSIFDKIKGKN